MDPIKSRIAAAIAVLVLGLGAGACGSSTAKSGTSKLTTITTFAIQDTVPYPLSGDSLAWQEAVFDELVGVDDDLKPVPELAESWTVSDDYKQIDLHLRDGVTFSDGTPFTAKDAVWNIDFIKDPKNAAQIGNQFADVKASAPDDKTVRLTSSAPAPQLFSALSVVPMMDPDSEIKTAVKGTGPFKIDRLVPGQQMILSRNAKYWRNGEPKLDQLVIKTVPDSSTAILNLKSHQADLLIGGPFNELPGLEKAGFNVMNQTGPGNFDILVAADKGALADARVRQALSMAFDRERFVKVTTNGYAKTTCTPFPAGSPVWSEDLDDCPFDLARAKQLLADAGQSNLNVTLQMPTVIPPLATFAPIYQADLKKIGVTAKIQNVEVTRWISLISTKKFGGLMGQSYTFGSLDPALLMTADPFRPDSNVQRFSSKEYTQLVADAKATTDPDQRIEAWRKVAAYIRDQAFDIEVANAPTIFVASKDVKGFATSPMALPQYENVTVG